MFSTQRKGLVTVHMKFQGMFFSASFSLRCSFGCTHLDPGSTLNQVLTGFGFDIDMECNITNIAFEYQTMKTIMWLVRFDCVVICASVFEMVYTCLRSQTFPGLFVQNPSQAFLTIFSEMGIDFELSRKIIYQYFKRTPKHLNFRYLSTELIVE